MEPNAVLFDLDGTLVDTLPDIHAVLRRTLEEAGRAAPGRNETRGMIGEGAEALVRAALARSGGADEALARDRCRRFAALYAARPAARSRVYPGARGCLTRLRRAGAALGVCTNKPERIARAVLDRLGLAGFFAVVVGGDTLAARKPHPDPLLAALSRLGAAPDRAAMVGDGLVDRDAARAAAVAFVAVSYGYGPVPARRLGADRIIDRLDRLPTALGALERRQGFVRSGFSAFAEHAPGSTGGMTGPGGRRALFPPRRRDAAAQAASGTGNAG